MPCRGLFASSDAMAAILRRCSEPDPEQELGWESQEADEKNLEDEKDVLVLVWMWVGLGVLMLVLLPRLLLPQLQ